MGSAVNGVANTAATYEAGVVRRTSVAVIALGAVLVIGKARSRTVARVRGRASRRARVATRAAGAQIHGSATRGGIANVRRAFVAIAAVDCAYHAASACEAGVVRRTSVAVIALGAVLVIGKARSRTVARVRGRASRRARVATRAAGAQIHGSATRGGIANVRRAFVAIAAVDCAYHAASACEAGVVRRTRKRVVALRISRSADAPLVVCLLALTPFVTLACGQTGGGAEHPSPSTGAAGEPGAAGETGTAGQTGTAGGGGTDSGSANTSDCPEFTEGKERGKIASPAIIEASGVVASRSNKGVLWIHNDSGDSPPRVFAVSATGADLGTYNIADVEALDWEDIAADEQYLYLADIGDNAEIRPFVTVYRVPEPAVSAEQLPVVAEVQGAEALVLEYPDGPHNAETILVDPTTSDLFIVTKSPDGKSLVFRATAPHSPDELVQLELVTTLAFSSDALPGIPLTTGGDVTPAGDAEVIRTYNSAFLWQRPKGASLAAAFDSAPCPVPLRTEPQGEAIGFDTDGAGYFTVKIGRAHV